MLYEVCRDSENIAYVGFKVEEVYQDSCLPEEGTWRILLTILIIQIEVKVTK